jgi:hypothetical protein
MRPDDSNRASLIVHATRLADRCPLFDWLSEGATAEPWRHAGRPSGSFGRVEAGPMVTDISPQRSARHGGQARQATPLSPDIRSFT